VCPGHELPCEYCGIFYRRELHRRHQDVTCLKCPIKCPNTNLGCGSTVPRDEMQRHTEECCAYREVPCAFCPDNVVLSNMTDHLKQCPGALLRCPHCAEEVARGDTAAHIQHECASVPCHNTDAGCRVVMPAAAITSHEPTCGYRAITCNKCSVEHQARNESRHQERCPEALLACTHCDKEVLRRLLLVHDDECPRIPVKCPVPECQHECPREQLDEHYQQQGVGHIKTLLSVIAELKNS
jgi:hypothetical protein